MNAGLRRSGPGVRSSEFGWYIKPRLRRVDWWARLIFVRRIRGPQLGWSA